MDLAKRDQKIELLRNLLDDRKQFLKERNTQLQDSSKDNEFLVEVAEDYARFYLTIKQQKQAQIAALMELSKYISKVTSDINESDQLLQQSRAQQKEIQEKIVALRKELEEIIKS
tara:strand:- start:7081 stop:7425 length:345 start_codon:yes stop_codon:yes gene_type:complete